MNQNLAMMKVRRMELVEQRTSLRLKARSLCRTIPTLINHTLEEIEDMKIAEAANAMDDLVVTQAELLSIGSKIAELEDSLGN